MLQMQGKHFDPALIIPVIHAYTAIGLNPSDATAGAHEPTATKIKEAISFDNW